MLEVGSQNMFELWNYSFTFLSIAVMAVFVIDMIGHSTKTISTLSFSWASIAGTVVGEITMTLMELYSLPATIPVACIACIISSLILALMLQKKDPETEHRRSRRSS